MPSPLDSAAFVRLLDNRLREVADSEREYQELQSMIPKFYRMLPSDSAWEEFFQVGATPDIPKFNGKLSYVGISPGYYSRIEPAEYAAGMIATRTLIDDKKYAVLEDRAAKLMRSAMRTKEKLGVRTFTMSFSSTFGFMTSEENLSLCNNSHTTKSGTSTSSGFDNLGTSSFSKAAVDATRLAMRLFRNDISERIAIGDNLALVVPDALADRANELNKTPYGYYSGERTENMDAGRYTIIPYMRLDDTSTTDWWMVDLDRMRRNLMWIERISPETKNTVDFETYQLKQAVYFRCAYGWTDWRWIYGHNN